jgi:hypothetical protein
MVIRKLKTTSVEWLKRYVPAAIKVKIHKHTNTIRIPLYSNCAMAGALPEILAASGNLKLYAVKAEAEIAIASGISMNAIIERCCGEATSRKYAIVPFFKIIPLRVPGKSLSLPIEFVIDFEGI